MFDHEYYGYADDDEFHIITEWFALTGKPWPMETDEFLPEPHREWASNICEDRNLRLNRTTQNYVWVPHVLATIFSSDLLLKRKLAVLRFFLSYLSEAILIDAGYDSEEATVLRADLHASLFSVQIGRSAAPAFLGRLTPPPDATPKEYELIEMIGDYISHHLDQERY